MGTSNDSVGFEEVIPGHAEGKAVVNEHDANGAEGKGADTGRMGSPVPKSVVAAESEALAKAVAKADAGGVAHVSMWKAGLFTKEDNFPPKFNFHKTFGLYCLLHFIYRFAHTEFVPATGGAAVDMNFGGVNAGSWVTLASLGPHFVLSASSLIFRLPKKRIIEGSRIWPEYRLHSIVFAYRSLACMVVTWAEAHYGFTTADKPPIFMANVAIVLLTMAAADLGTWYVGKDASSSTIQDLAAPPYLRYFFSVAQFHATAGCLVGIRRMSTQFIYVWIIQITAFLLTLRRKNLLPHTPLIWTYAIMLSYGFVVAIIEGLRASSVHMTMTLASVAALLRLGLGLNKYVVWSAAAVLAHFARQTVLEPIKVTHDDVWETRWLCAHLASFVGVALLGVYKIKYPRASKAKAA